MMKGLHMRNMCLYVVKGGLTLEACNMKTDNRHVSTSTDQDRLAFLRKLTRTCLFVMKSLSRTFSLQGAIDEITTVVYTCT